MSARQTIAVNPGDRFGRLTVLTEEYRVLPSRPSQRIRGARCRCDCGAITWARAAGLVGGCVVSCGCRREEHLSRYGRSPENRDRVRDAWRSHGLADHPLYTCWRSMLARCENLDSASYPDYGGRGIAVCPEWHDVAVFITWIEANLGPRPLDRTAGGRPVYTLDRIDNEGNYEPGNVRWATWSQQSRNRRALAWHRRTAP